jgi:hypothetical protein
VSEPTQLFWIRNGSLLLEVLPGESWVGNRKVQTRAPSFVLTAFATDERTDIQESITVLVGTNKGGN